jgi:hypothetical protein
LHNASTPYALLWPRVILDVALCRFAAAADVAGAAGAWRGVPSFAAVLNTCNAEAVLKSTLFVFVHKARTPRPPLSADLGAAAVFALEALGRSSDLHLRAERKTKGVDSAIALQTKVLLLAADGTSK